MNIHLKIEAKKLLIVNGFNIIQSIYSEDMSRSGAYKMVYKVFNTDTFLLPYKVQKLSKRVRRNLI